MNCSSSWEVLDSSRWLSSGEHSVSYSPERGCQWWTDPWGVPATHIFKSHQACCSFFSPSPMEVENPQDSEVDSEVLGLKYPFVCLLYTSVSSVGRSFCIHHFMVLRVSASLPLRLFWFEVTMLSLEVLFFFEKVSRALWLCYHWWEMIHPSTIQLSAQDRCRLFQKALKAMILYTCSPNTVT